MGNWGGFGPPEFGGHPVELEFSLESYEGPKWVAAAMRYRSGWLAVGEVEMQTAFDCTTQVLTAAIDDGGEPLGQWVAEALFSMNSGLPKDLDHEPPEELDLALDALYWDFLGRCDLDHLRMLEERERATALRSGTLEARRRLAYDTAESMILKLYARRRRESGDPARRAAIDVEIAEIEEKQAAAQQQHREILAAVSRELDDFDADVMESLKNHGRLTKLYALHWTVQRSLVAPVDQVFLPRCYSPPMHILNMCDTRSSYLTRDFIAMSKDPAVRAGAIPTKQPIRVVPRQALPVSAAEGHKATKAERLARDRENLERLYRQWKQTDPEKFERERKHREHVAEFNRRRAAEKQLAAATSVSTPKQSTGVTVDDGNSRDQRVLESGRIAKLEHQAAEHVRRRASERELVMQRHGGPEHDDDREQRRSNSPEPASMLDSQISISSDEEALASVKAQVPVATNKLLSFSQTEPGATLQLGCASNQDDAASSTQPPRTRSRIVAGDCVLLRLEGGGFVEYALRGDVNIPARGVVSLKDQRAKAILGRNVGDRVTLDVFGRRTAAVVEKIVVRATNAAAGVGSATVGEARPEAPLSGVARPRHVIAGDKVLLRFDDLQQSSKPHGRFILYTLEGDINNPLRGIIALDDPRAQAILGRNVGDRVCLEIAGRERFALVEKILNFEQDASA